MKKVYFDNAATSFPKPDGVGSAMLDYIKNIGCNINRSSYDGAYKAGETVFETRSRLKDLLGAEDEKNIIFTPSDTYSLNMLIKGIVRPGDHIAVSSMEHNAVMRPVEALAAKGIITYDVIECDVDGSISEQKMQKGLEHILEKAQRERKCFRAVVLTHGSNVCGSILPIAAAGKFCRNNNIFLIADCAQTAGILDIDMEKMGLDAVSFSGHKSLYGPQGIGGFAVSSRLAGQMDTIIEGGTGSFSHLLTMPEELPDRFEAGTMNIPGIYGLNAGLEFIGQTGIDKIRDHENAVAESFVEKLTGTDGLHVYSGRLPVVSLACDRIDPAELAYRLETDYGIWTRVGLHCAPTAHRTIGTFPSGTVRFSFGYFNTLEEAEYGAQAVRSICERC